LSGFIPDTSVVMPWCFGDEANDFPMRYSAVWRQRKRHWFRASGRLRFSNALLFAKQRGRVTEAGILGFLEDLRSFRIHVDVEGLSRAVTDIRSLGERYRLTAYDAAYLELSMRTGVPLATMDNALKKASIAAGAKLVAS
jgi:predicted nucleic acid-binding protein